MLNPIEIDVAEIASGNARMTIIKVFVHADVKCRVHIHERGLRRVLERGNGEEYKYRIVYQLRHTLRSLRLPLINPTKRACKSFRTFIETAKKGSRLGKVRKRLKPDTSTSPKNIHIKRKVKMSSYLESIDDDGVLEPLAQLVGSNAVINDGFDVISDENFTKIEYIKHGRGGVVCGGGG